MSNNSSKVENTLADVSPEEEPVFIKRLNFAIAITLIAFMPITILVNSLVILSVVVFKRMRHHTNFLLCSLAVAHLLVGAVTCPLYITFYWGSSSLQYNRHACLAWFGSIVMGCGASLFNLLLIVIDRFIAVSIPMLHIKVKRSSRFLAISLTILWVYVFFLSVLPFMGWNNFLENVRCQFYTSLPMAYVYWTAYGVVGFCTLVSSVLYYKIFKIIKNQKNMILTEQWLVTAIYEVKFQEDITFIKTTAIVFFLFVLFWGPYFLVGPLKYSSLPYENVESVKNLALLLAFTNSMVNPFVYVYTRQEFRTAFQVLICSPFKGWSSVLNHKLNTLPKSGIVSSIELRT